MKLQQRTIRFAIAALVLCVLLTPAGAATISTGTIYFTTFQNQSGTNGPTTSVWSTTFTYDSVTGISVSAPAVVATTTGADGITFDPNDATFSTLLIGEQDINQVAKIGTNGTPLGQAAADNTTGCSTPFTCGQAYALVATPDNKSLLALPNDIGKYGQFNVNVLPLQPFGPGTPHTVTGDDNFIAGASFDGNGVLYYGDADDQQSAHFGQLNTSTWVTARSTIIDDVDHVAGQGNLPSHAVTYDKYSGCFMLGSGDNIWQLCSDGAVPPTFHITAKIATGDQLCHSASGATILCGYNNWDSILVDGAGQLFAANNNGDLYFIDYKATKSIGSATYKNAVFLAESLDDLAPHLAVTPPNPPNNPGGCPATQGFWHKSSKWPAVNATVDGITYNGKTDFSMVIGGMTYSQSNLMNLLPSGSLHSGNYANSLSQLVAAVLNYAAGGKHTAAADAAITSDNAVLNGFQIFCGSGLCTPNATVAVGVQANLNALDAYNSAVGLNCIEAVGLTLGSGK